MDCFLVAYHFGNNPFCISSTKEALSLQDSSAKLHHQMARVLWAQLKAGESGKKEACFTSFLKVYPNMVICLLIYSYYLYAMLWIPCFNTTGS